MEDQNQHNNTNNTNNTNVVIFSFMEQGHIIPFLAMAHLIERRGYAITFVTTPLNATKLRQSLPAESAISLRELPFRSSDHGLPPNSENMDSLPCPLVLRLLRASAALRPAFTALLGDLRPLCVVVDIFFDWTAAVCIDLRVFHAVFSGCGGFGLACYCSLWLNLPHRKLALDGAVSSENFGEFSLSDFEKAKTLHVSQLPANIAEADGDDLWSRYRSENLSGWFNSDGFLFNWQISCLGGQTCLATLRQALFHGEVGQNDIRERESPKSLGITRNRGERESENGVSVQSRHSERESGSDTKRYEEEKRNVIVFPLRI